MKVRIELPAPVGKQVDVLASKARFKPVRAGRRGGKTRLAFITAALGHAAIPNGKGMLGGNLIHDDGSIESGAVKGGNILWVPPTIPQGRAIWREELEPRFKGKQGFTINQTERRVIAPNGGSIEILSGEAIDSARGRRFDGAVLDEARDMDLEYVFDAVVRPTLIDRRGWCMWISSTKAGSDFNQLCTDVLEGKRNPALYETFHWRTRDNPTLSPAEIAEVYDEYAGREHVAQEELDALLLTGIAGLGFPEYVDEVAQGIHTIPNRIIPNHWRWVAAMDWGYVKGCILLAAVGPEGQTEVVWEKAFERQHARQVARDFLAESAQFPRPDYMACDSGIWADTGLLQGTTIADEFLAGLLEGNGNTLQGLPRMIPMKKGAGSRVAGKNLLHRLLRWQDLRHPDTQLLLPWALPRLRVQQKCTYLRQTFRTIPLDEKNPEDVNTKSDDHGYDTIRYLVASLPEHPDKLPEPVDEDRHPGYDVVAKKRRTAMAPWEVALRGQDDRGYDDMTPGFWRPGGP